MKDPLVLDELDYWWMRAVLASRNKKPLRVTVKDFERISELKQEAGLWLWRNETNTFLGIKVEIVDY
jgi:DNA polymerase III psi subunit